ncbi:potassium/sodium hyperpolarization-activated cyclic nucleotide-gated channel 1-like [Apis laboriosa]|uniref:potassium/sodium hyperpolarization-activated cyclic nucleotide-gated channel 1-like n=1 Tax=Apis laboriosa TaxID=183418 RepID=UPI001CC6BBEC|nr:potassium/sodium hyperpolarization-activated cyclic nucleotide-gated channel 1-like [Apis laboriosa]
MLHAEHECEIAEEENDILFLPGRGIFQKLRDILYLSLLPSRKNPAAFYFLRSSAAITQEKRRQWRSFPNIIHPFSLFRHIWDISMIVVISLVLIIIPYQASFGIKEKLMTWTIIKNIMLLILCCDVIVNLRTGYFDKDMHSTELDPKKIVDNYLKRGTFIMDFIGSFPTDLFYLSALELIVARKWTSLLCIFRVFSLANYIEKITSLYNIPLAVKVFVVLIFWLLLFFHWQTCLQWLIPLISKSMYELQRPANTSWIEVANLWEVSKSEQYLSSLMRAITTFMRVGLIYTHLDNAGEVYLITLTRILGMIVPWFIVTSVLNFLRGKNSSRLRYQGTVAQLKHFMSHKQLPYSTQKRIIQYYEFRFQYRFFRESEIINTISTQMRHEIRMHTCRKLVENVTFFNNLPLTLLGQIVALLKFEIFLTNDVIVRVNQPGDCMYFIASGTVGIYTDSGKEVCHLDDGAHFGEVALIMPNELRVASVVAVEICELYRLNRADFMRTIHPYPMLWERIKKIAIERHEKTMILTK